MELFEKINQIRKEKKLKIQDMHTRMKKVFGPKAVSYRTLLRLIHGQHDGRDSTIYQACTGLNITVADLKSKLPQETGIPGLDFVAWDDRKDRYIYNAGAFADILTGPRNSFLAIELVLKPQAKTRQEQENQSSEKFVYVKHGKMVCCVGDKKIAMRKDDCLTFDSSQPHHLENQSRQKTRCLVIKRPNTL